MMVSLLYVIFGHLNIGDIIVERNQENHENDFEGLDETAYVSEHVHGGVGNSIIFGVFLAQLEIDIIN